MKKASIPFAAQYNNQPLEKFQPLYLLASEELEPPKQIHIFINSGKKNCYIQKKGIWRELTINHSLVGSQKETYYFQAKDIYHYLEIGHDGAYLALKDSECKILFKNLGLSKEILQELALPNLEQLDTLAIAKSKLVAEKILKLTKQINRVNTEIIRFEKVLSVLTDARPAMERLNNDKKERFTLVDLDDQINLFNRQKHYSEYVKLKAQIKISALLIIDNPKILKEYERILCELNLQKRELTRSLQDQQFTIVKLKKVAECFTDLNSSSSDILVIEQINPQIKLIEKNLQKNMSSLEKIEEEIQALTKSEVSENAEAANKKIQSLFFNGVIKPNPTQCAEIGLNKP